MFFVSAIKLAETCGPAGAALSAKAVVASSSECERQYARSD